MEAFQNILDSFSKFINSIVDYIKNLVATIRKFNDENT